MRGGGAGVFGQASLGLYRGRNMDVNGPGQCGLLQAGDFGSIHGNPRRSGATLPHAVICRRAGDAGRGN